MIPENQIDFFNKNRYFIVENIINDSVCDKFKKFAKIMEVNFTSGICIKMHGF